MYPQTHLDGVDAPGSPAGISAPVIWITGLSGAGKSTVAQEVTLRLKAAGKNPVLLDGDELRAALGIVGSFERDERLRLAYVYARLCRLLSAQGHPVVIATIALFHGVHAWNRENLPNYVEVFLDVPIGELQRRDPKGLYGTAGTSTAVFGVGFAAEFPLNPDLVVTNYAATTAGRAADQIIQHCQLKGAW